MIVLFAAEIAKQFRDLGAHDVVLAMVKNWPDLVRPLGCLVALSITRGLS